MPGLKPFLAGLLLGGTGMMLSLQYHLVRTSEGLIVVPRSQAGALRSAYVDVRNWSPTMWGHYPDVSESLIKSGRGNLILQESQPRPATPVPQGSARRNAETAAEKTQKAMEALVPIRFSLPEPEIPAHVDIAPPARERTSIVPPMPPPSYRPPPERSEPVKGTFGSGFSGLPVLNPPVPISPSKTPVTPPEANSSQGSQWVRSLIKSLVPSTADASARGPIDAQGDAHLPYPVQMTPQEQRSTIPPASRWPPEGAVPQELIPAVPPLS